MAESAFEFCASIGPWSYGYSRRSAKQRVELANSQHPFAFVVGCDDSRVPHEIVFDERVGDLLVLRVAGNVIDDHSLGSIEYPVDHLVSGATVSAVSNSLRHRRIKNGKFALQSNGSNLMSGAYCLHGCYCHR